MKELQITIIELLKENKVQCYVSRLMFEAGESVLIISEKPIMKVMKSWKGTIIQTKVTE